jgi:hypothetical protein
MVREAAGEFARNPFKKKVAQNRSLVSRGRLERGQRRLVPSGPTGPFDDDQAVKIVLTLMLNPTAHEKKMTWTM